MMVFTFVLISNLSAFAQFTPPETVLASDQNVITVRSIEYEAAQFKALGKWNSSLHKLNTSISKRDQLKKDFERLKVLLPSGGASTLQVEQAEMNYQKSEANVARAQDDVEKAKTEVTVNKIKIQQEGNPGTNHSKAMSIAMLESLRLEKINIETSLASHKANLAYFEKYVKNGKYLLDRGVISIAEYERRVLELDAARDQVQSTTDEIQGIADAIAGAELTQKRV